MFDPNWLNLRYAFDNAARNPQLEWDCINQFAFLSELKIIDLGTGTGANFRYYAEKLPQNQSWICVEHDPELTPYFWENVKKWANSLNFDVKEGEKGLFLAKAGQQIEVQLVHGDILDLDKLVNLMDIDLIVANAVFDLFSQDQFEAFSHILSQHQLSLLFTLNYEDMHFFPVEDQDAFFVQKYNSHMERAQDFGKGMGIQANEMMKLSLEKRLGQVELGGSNWDIQAKDTEMLRYLLHFMEDALSNWPLNETELGALRLWLARKRHMLDQQQLSLQVRHRDLYATFFPKIAFEEAY